MAIERKVVSGVGNQTVDVTGWGYARVKTNGSTITLGYQGIGGYSQDFSDGDRVIIPTGTTSVKVSAFTGYAWSLFMQKTIPAVNQSELKLAITDSGKLIVEGDDDIVFRGQDVDLATVSISGLRDDLDTLGKLYQDALSQTKTTDAAARYIKMKNAVLLRY